MNRFRRRGFTRLLSVTWLAGCAFAVSLAVQALSTAALAAGNESWDSVLAAAKKEGTVTFYSAANPGPLARIVAGFKKAYPDIAIEFQRIPSGPLISKLDQERGSGAEGADVANATEVGWFDQRGKEGTLLKPIGPSAAAWPANYLLDGTVVIGAMEPFIMSYNTKTVTPPPKEYADLIAPRFKGKIGLSELASIAVIAYYDFLEKTQGTGFLAKLAAQKPKLYVGSVPIAQSVASGEVDIGGFGVPTAVKPLMEQSAPINYVVPGHDLGIRYGVAAFGWAKHPNAARVFLDYVMSRDGQAAWNGNGETASPLTGIPGALDASTIVPYDPADWPAEKEKQFRTNWDKLFK